MPQAINGAPAKARWSEEERAKKLSRMMAQGERFHCMVPAGFVCCQLYSSDFRLWACGPGLSSVDVCS